MGKLGGIFFAVVLWPVLAHADFVFEAESANSIVSPFKVFKNATASGGKVVAKPSGVSGTGKAVFKLNVAQAGTYQLSARVYAATSASNSFLVQINGGTKVTWNLPLSGVWQSVAFSQNFTLATGVQTLTIYSKEANTGLDQIQVRLVTAAPAPTPTPTPAPTPTPTPAPSRGLWVWTTVPLLSNDSEQSSIIDLARAAQITEVYLYLTAPQYRAYQSQLAGLIRRLSAAGIRAWGLEGYRGYFSDSYGPQDLYGAADALVAYNSSVAADQRFVGFHSDMEPQDGQGAEFPTSFHNGLKDSSLNRSGGGVWYATQAQDREMLMRDWLTIHTALLAKMRDAGLKFAASMPSWTDDYYGEQVSVTFNGVRQGVMKHMMAIVDQYVVMSYNTDPNNVAARLAGELAYADTLPLSQRPQVFGALETHLGAGANISYADTPPKNHRSSVLADIDAIISLLSSHPSFSGMNIHDWEGWRDLAP